MKTKYYSEQKDTLILQFSVMWICFPFFSIHNSFKIIKGTVSRDGGWVDNHGREPFFRLKIGCVKVTARPPDPAEFAITRIPISVRSLRTAFVRQTSLRATKVRGLVVTAFCYKLTLPQHTGTIVPLSWQFPEDVMASFGSSRYNSVSLTTVENKLFLRYRNIQYVYLYFYVVEIYSMYH
jgi:hypothetical protein